MIGEKEIQQIARQVLSASEAEETEVVVLGLEERLTRFANNVIHQNVAEADRIVLVRVALGRRIGMARTNDLSEEGLQRVARTAVDEARIRPEDPEYPGLPEPAAVMPVTALDERTAGYTPQDRADDIAGACRRAEEAAVTAAGAFRTAIHEFAVANSHDLFVYHPTTIADLTTVVMTEDSAGYAAGASWKVDEVDVEGLVAQAIQRALRGRDPQPLEPGVYPVVLESYAVGDLVSFITDMAGAMMVAEGRSWMIGRKGASMMSPQVSIWDDGRDPAGWPLPFDFQGLPRQRVDVVSGGVVGGVVTDRRWAALENVANTGHALPAVKTPLLPWQSATSHGPIPLHPVMGGGDATVEEMIAAIDRGIYITRFHYTRLVHPREALVTGMTRDGTFLIEKGEIARPVQNLRFTESYVEALGKVERVGREVHAERPAFAVVRAPALQLSAFHFTGATSF